MLTSLSCLVDKLSEIYSKNCRDKNCESKCDFTGLKNNKLHYKCNECKKRQLKPINHLTKSFQIHMSFVIETLINLFFH